MSYGSGADQREDDVIVLLTLEPVHCGHLQDKGQSVIQAAQWLFLQFNEGLFELKV